MHLACYEWEKPCANRSCTAMSPQEVTEKLQLSKLKDKIWYVIPSCATTGEGLAEGLTWLSNNIKTPAAPVKK